MQDGSIVIPPTIPGGKSEPAPAEGNVVALGDGQSRITVDGSGTKPATPEAPKADRPAWLPEKFKSVEDMAAAYTELEKKQGTAPKVETPVADPTTKLTSAELAGVTDEFAKNGKLSDDTYKKLSDKGLTKEIVDGHIEGQKARVEKYTNTLHEALGGKQSFEKVVEWAGANLTDAEIDSVNKVLSSGDEAMAKTVLAGLQTRYTAAVGTDPKLIGGPSVAGASGAKPYASNQEVTEAMSNPKYRTDPAYREKVYARLAVTNI